MTWVALLAPVGVLIMVGVSWLLGGWRTERLPHADAAVGLLHGEAPGFAPTRSVLAADGRGALFTDAGGAVAAVFALGDRFVTRVFERGNVRACVATSQPDGTVRLTIRTADVTAPKVAVVLAAKDAPPWRERVVALR